MTIGIFDSGRGGRFVAEKMRRLLPTHDYIVVNDKKNAPYGEKSYDTINELTHRAIKPLVEQCSLIVIACNTATAAALESLRTEYPDHTFIGFEPMIKPAAYQSGSKHLTLLATHATANSERTRQLIKAHANDFTIDAPNTTGWATAIDKHQIDAISLDEVRNSVENGSDSIIIGCTHYTALIPQLQVAFPAATIYEPTEAIVRRIVELTADSRLQ